MSAAALAELAKIDAAAAALRALLADPLDRPTPTAPEPTGLANPNAFFAYVRARPPLGRIGQQRPQRGRGGLDLGDLREGGAHSFTRWSSGSSPASTACAGSIVVSVTVRTARGWASS